MGGRLWWSHSAMHSPPLFKMRAYVQGKRHGQARVAAAAKRVSNDTGGWQWQWQW